MATIYRVRVLLIGCMVLFYHVALLMFLKTPIKSVVERRSADEEPSVVIDTPSVRKTEIVKQQQLNLTRKNESGRPQRLWREELEKTLRVFRQDIEEIGWFVDSQLRKLKSSTSSQEFDETLKLFREQKSSAVADVESLWTPLSPFKQNASRILTEKALQRIKTLQNPQSCERFLHCELPSSGFGSVLHHVVECLIAAHRLGRVARIGNSGSRKIPSYATEYDHVFLPLSDSCDEALDLVSSERWSVSSLKSSSKVIRFSHNDVYAFPGPSAPPSIPKDLAAEAGNIYEEADVWWTGCYVRYAMRMREDVKAKVNTATSNVNFSQPVVGLHIRRTDKLTSEASFHGLEEYMFHAEAWYDVQSMLKQADAAAQRSVFIASDDRGVIEEAKNKYPNYKVFEGANSNARSNPGLIGILSDIIALSRCDYVVCTFSSNVCRVVHELMITDRPDGFRRFHSLDDIYYFSAGRYVRAERDHKGGGNELEMKVGDLIGLRGNHWNGYSLGKNVRTGKVGLFPSYKARTVLNIVHTND